MLWFIVACVAPAFCVSFVATSAIKQIAPRMGLIDRPTAAKHHATHQQATPLGGGLGIYLGVLIPIISVQLIALAARAMPSAFQWVPADVALHMEGVLYRSGTMWAILLAGSVLVVIGLLDDIAAIPWPPRLIVQFLVAGGLVAGGVQATLFVDLPWVGMGMTVLWIVLLTNALNFLDNMDGLSGGIGLISAVLFAIVMLMSVSEPRWLVGGALLVLVGSLAGFLCHNRPPASIFMGDSGSMFIGLLLASLTVLGTFYDRTIPSRHVILAPLCVLAVPLYDFTSVVLIRLKRGHSPFHPDKNHFSHRLVKLGLSPRNAVLTVHLTTLTTGLGALLLYQVSGWGGALLVVALVLCVLSIIAILESTANRQDARDEDRRS